jgi:hypothetical protein
LFAIHAGEYSLEDALADMEAAATSRGKSVSVEEKSHFSELFMETLNAVDSKQLRPFVRTQYMRTAFQVRDCFYECVLGGGGGDFSGLFPAPSRKRAARLAFERVWWRCW